MAGMMYVRQTSVEEAKNQVVQAVAAVVVFSGRLLDGTHVCEGRVVKASVSTSLHCEGEKKNPRVLRSAGRAQGNSLDPSSVSGSLGLLPAKSSPNPPPSESRLSPRVGTFMADRVAS